MEVEVNRKRQVWWPFCFVSKTRITVSFLLGVPQYARRKEPECIQFKDKTFYTSKKCFTVAYTQRMLRDKKKQPKQTKTQCSDSKGR